MKDIIILNVHWNKGINDKFMELLERMESMVKKVNQDKIWYTNQYIIRDYVYDKQSDFLMKIAEAKQLWYGCIVFQTIEKIKPIYGIYINHLDEMGTVMMAMGLYSALKS